MDAMRLGRSIHMLGSPSFSWWEVRCLISGRWPEAHTTRHQLHGAALLEPATQLLAMIADATRGANWQRGGDERAPRPDPSASVLFPVRKATGEPDRDRLSTAEPTPESVAAIRERLAVLRRTAKPI